MSRLRKLAEQQATPNDEIVTAAVMPDSDEDFGIERKIMDFFGEEDASGGMSGTDYTFVSLDANRTELRILPLEPPFIHFYAHKYNVAGTYTPRLDLEWVIKNKEVLNFLIDAGKINQAEIDVINKHGDPFTRLAKLLAASKDKRSKDFFSKSRYFWHVIKRPNNEAGILETSGSFYNNVRNILREGFDVINEFDLAVIGNGKSGLERKYETYSATRRKVNDNLEEIDSIDLLEAVVNLKYASPTTKAEHLGQAYGNIAEEFGLDLEDWIVEDDIDFGG